MEDKIIYVAFKMSFEGPETPIGTYDNPEGLYEGIQIFFGSKDIYKDQYRQTEKSITGYLERNDRIVVHDDDLGIYAIIYALRLNRTYTY